MPLPKRWQSLDRSTVGGAPARHGVYELGRDGEVTAVGSEMLRDELKEALAYGDGDRVRRETTRSRERAAELAADHRRRLE
jgi:hypothetical protein